MEVQGNGREYRMRYAESWDRRCDGEYRMRYAESWDRRCDGEYRMRYEQSWYWRNDIDYRNRDAGGDRSDRAKPIVSTEVDPVLEEVLGSISQWLGEEFSAFFDLKQNLKELSSALANINDVLQYAKNKPKSQGLINWLRKIKNAAAEGQDLLDIYAAKKGNILSRIRVAHGTKELLKILDEIAVEIDRFKLRARLCHKEESQENKNVAADLKHERLKEWVDRNFSKFSFTLNARSLVISWGHTSECWSWNCFETTSNEKIEVAELNQVCWLDVTAKIKKSNLIPGVQYEIAYVVQLKNEASGWKPPITLGLSLPDGTMIRSRQVSIRDRPREKWFELNVGKFLAEESDSGGDVCCKMLNHGGHQKRGLVIKGVNIRPKKCVYMRSLVVTDGVNK